MTTIWKQKKVKKVRQKLKLFRANEPLLSVLMWGVNYSFSALNHIKTHAMLLKDDFKAYMKVKINNYYFNKEHMPSRFKLKEYCPLVFKNLRNRFGVNNLDYWDAFTRSQPAWDVARGKSGSRFLVTYNRQFVAKTITSEEVEQLLQLLEDYYSYIVSCHGQTLLPQYLGLYRLTVSDQDTYILVMRNVFSPRMTVHKKYDLKGNSMVREANEKEKSKPLPTLKDNEFLNEVCRIHIGDEAKTRLLTTLENDIQFLQESNLMDYSLLIGIHDVELGNQPISPVPDDSTMERNGSPEGRLISAGDGMGSLHSQWHLRRLSKGQYGSIDASGCPISLGAQLSGDEEEVDEEAGNSSDHGIPIPGTLHGLTPPDSPPVSPFNVQLEPDGLHPSMEFYAIRSSPDAPHKFVYFISIIDIFSRYGMRKRTAHTYKNVKHGSGGEAGTAKPETYGRRLLDFMSQSMV